jgi:predicted transcriptional regulator
MHPNTDQLESYGAPSGDQPPAYRRVTVQEAAKLLGISPEAVRARIKRGTLQKDKDPDGTVSVRLDVEQTRSIEDRSSSESAVGTERARLVATLEEQVSFLRAELVTRNEELRRKDHIIAALTERIPELEAPREPVAGGTQRPVTFPEESPRAHAPVEPVHPVERPSWWRRFFGLE